MSNLKKYNNISFFENKKITKVVNFSNSFGASCNKITLHDNTEVVIKELINTEAAYDSIFYEGKSLEFMGKIFPDIFPKVLYLKKNFLIMEFIKHNNLKTDSSEKELAFNIAKIHKIKNDKYGFNFDPPIGALKQPSELEKSWVDFYGKKRLGMIYNLISATNPMPKIINQGIEKILKNLKNIIPDNPKPSLIHGDLWEGNILYNNGQLVGLIDLGIYYAHSEMEIAYLDFFKSITEDFYQYYSSYNYLDKNYKEYSEIYQLYYCLLNVHLWSRDYVKNTNELLKKYI